MDMVLVTQTRAQSIEKGQILNGVGAVKTPRISLTYIEFTKIVY